MSSPSSQSGLYFQDLQYFDQINKYQKILTNKQILSAFDQSSFYEIRNLQKHNQLNIKLLNILKIFLEYLENYIVALHWKRQFNFLLRGRSS